MNVAAWIIQGALAAIFLGSGLVKALQPRDKMAANPNLAYVEDLSEPAIKAIGVVEVLAAIGLVLPWLTGIARVLTPLAASGLVIVMIGALVLHRRRGETKALPANIVLGAAALFVAWVRFGDLG